MCSQLFIYRSSLMTLLLFFTVAAAAEELHDAAEVARTASADEQGREPVNVSNEAVSSSAVLKTTRGPRSFLGNFVDDQKRIWTSPSRISGEDLKWIVPLALGTGVAIGTDNLLNEELPRRSGTNCR